MNRLFSILSFLLIYLLVSCENNAGKSDEIITGKVWKLKSDEIITGKVWKLVSAGSSHTCAIDNAGQAYCWGSNSYGELGDSIEIESFLPLNTDTNGILYDKELVSISSGFYHTCTIDSEGKAYCWGKNDHGQLGNGSKTDSPVPVGVDSEGVLKNRKLVSVVAGSYFTCASDSETKFYCWGSNNDGRFGESTKTDSISPAEVILSNIPEDRKIINISFGNSHSCAIDDKGAAYCWGQNFYGGLGNGNQTDSLVPVAVDTNGVLKNKKLISISIGYYYTCAVTSEGKAYCWGSNLYGGLGQGSGIQSSNVPVEVDTDGVLSGKKLVSITANDLHACTLDNAGRAYCWGWNGYGQLGNGTKSYSDIPVAIEISTDMSNGELVSITLGYSHTCALSDKGDAYCWGSNENGQLGNGSGTYSRYPVNVYESGILENSELLQLTAGREHTCAVDSKGSVYCWGTNSAGQLGDGTQTDSSIPVEVNKKNVLNSGRFIYASAGTAHTCAIDSEGKAYCWGYSYYGQLGNGSAAIEDESPVLPEDAYVYSMPCEVDTKGFLNGKKLITLSSGDLHTCAVDSEGKAYCWGLNKYGGLGNGSDTLEYSSVPVNVDTDGVINDRKLVYISAGSEHTCAVDSEGSAYCWGSNDAGQLGDGSLIDRYSPVKVNSNGALYNKKIISVSTGEKHTCALDSYGLIYCWGFNYNGQLGNKDKENSSVPVKIDPVIVQEDGKHVYISSGSEHTCAVDSEGSAYCWGNNDAGQLGDGMRTDKSETPVKINITGMPEGVKIVSIDSGYEHTCAIINSGKAYCWGNNKSGQLGNGIESDIPVPVKVETEKQ